MTEMSAAWSEPTKYSYSLTEYINSVVPLSKTVIVLCCRCLFEMLIAVFSLCLGSRVLIDVTCMYCSAC